MLDWRRSPLRILTQSHYSKNRPKCWKTSTERYLPKEEAACRNNNGVTVTGEYSASLLERLKKAVKDEMGSKDVLFLQDNVPVYKNHVAQTVVYICESDYYLFPKIKKEIQGNTCFNDEEMKLAVNAYLEGWKNNFLRGNK